MEYKDRTFSEEIEVDGHTFDHCRFEGAEIIYSGGQHPTFIECSMNDCRVSFQGSAARTLGWLKIMIGSPLGVVTSAAIRDIFEGKRAD